MSEELRNNNKEYVSDEFIHDTVISNYFRKEKGECLL